MESLPAYLDALCAGQDLSRDQARQVFAAVMRGEVDEVPLAALLTALRCKGETPEEIAGAASAMREAATLLDTGAFAVADSCGTGGDGAQTVNVSTAVALVAAEAGVRVAKHGNRSISSRCGSADVLEACGVAIEASPEVSRRCLDEVGICFLFAPQYHRGVRHAMGVRRTLGVRTLFNLLGPLCNPARPRWQLVGVYDPRRCRVLAETLRLLGCERALVVHGGGLDEIALHAPTTAALLEGGRVRELVIEPSTLGVAPRGLDALAGGSPGENGAWLRRLLAGQGDPAHADAVAINAGALLWIAGEAASHLEGTHAARSILETGRALARLERWAEISRGA